jgi:3-dehydroquinate synthetase
MLDAMGMDKKVLRKQMRFVLLDGIGRATFDDAYDAALLQEVLEAADQ